MAGVDVAARRHAIGRRRDLEAELAQRLGDVFAHALLVLDDQRMAALAVEKALVRHRTPRTTAVPSGRRGKDRRTVVPCLRLKSDRAIRPTAP